MTRKLLKPPPPMPDYVSPFAKASRKEPVTTIRMTTRTGSAISLESLIADQETMRSKVDPAKYLGSAASLTESITSTLRLGTPFRAAGEALLETEDTVPGTGQESRSALFSRGSTRTLGTVRAVKTAPPPPTGGPVLSPQPTRPAFSRGRNYSIDGEIDRDATFVDADAVLSSDVVTPLPSLDALSERQLKLIGTNTIPHREIIGGEGVLSPSPPPLCPLTPSRKSDIKAGELLELAAPIGEKMMINRARLLFLQHHTQLPGSQTGRQSVKYPVSLKPPTAPAGGARPSPVQSPLPSLTLHDGTTSFARSERATTAPVTRVAIRKTPRPNRTPTLPRGGKPKLDSCMTVQPLVSPSRAHYPAPPPSQSSRCSSRTETEIFLPRTPIGERCATYRLPSGRTSRNYLPLDGEECSLSQTPLLHNFSSLSSLLPSSHTLGNGIALS